MAKGRNRAQARPGRAVRPVPTVSPSLIFASAGLLVACLAIGGCGEKGAPVKVTAKTPAEFQGGEAKFNTHCARCHGERAAGTDHGPPLVQKIYEPSHHGDGAFYRAVANGVRAHHWPYGNMPKIPDVTDDEVAEIIQYVRWLQRQAGIT